MKFDFGEVFSEGVFIPLFVLGFGRRSTLHNLRLRRSPGMPRPAWQAMA
ncbi:MAG: hypothetical protein WCC12_01870 [Anaerolineales bacterium]